MSVRQSLSVFVLTSAAKVLRRPCGRFIAIHSPSFHFPSLARFPFPFPAFRLPLSPSSVPFSFLFHPLPRCCPPSPFLLLEVGPLTSSYEVWGSTVRELSLRGLGRSPNRNRIWCILALIHGIWWQQF